MGSPDFAVPPLQALHAAGHAIAAVYCQPPRPAGRGQRETPCPVQRAAEALGLAVRSPARLRQDAAAQAAFAALDLDAAIVAAYGLILPPAMLAAPRLGCLNIHASLLPRWRGAAPIHAALLAGDAETGVTIMQMEAGLDTGPMLRHAAIPIGPATTLPELHDALASLGAKLIVETLAAIPPAVPQPADGVTYAGKLGKADGAIDWTRPAALIERQVRALNPWPGTFFTCQGEAIRLHAALAVAGAGTPGEVLDNAPTIACGAGALRLLRLQRPGRGPLGAEDFLRGFALPPGSRLG